MDYHDEAALTDYIWMYYSNLMTEFERRMGWAEFARMKQTAGYVDVAQHILRTKGIAGDPAAESILAEGLDVFRWRVARRLLKEYGDQIAVNRCPACGRITRTPKAQQCFFCGHDWHCKPTDGTP